MVESISKSKSSPSLPNRGSPSPEIGRSTIAVAESVSDKPTMMDPRRVSILPPNVSDKEATEPLFEPGSILGSKLRLTMTTLPLQYENSDVKAFARSRLDSDAPMPRQPNPIQQSMSPTSKMLSSRPRDILKKLSDASTAVQTNPTMNNIIQLGLMFMDPTIVPAPKKTDCTCSAALLQHATSLPAASPDPRDGKFWSTLSTAHFHVWLKDGILAQPSRLVLAKHAAEKALSFPEMQSNPGAWEMLVSILLYSGALPVAMQSLNIMLQKFPMHPKVKGIYMFHAMCSFGMSRYDDASIVLKDLLSSPPRPYSACDICMLLGRVYDKCSEDEEGDDLLEREANELNMAQRAKNRYLQAYKVASKRGKVQEGESAVDWLSNPRTWRLLAEKCAIAGHFLFAVDCYQQALERDKKAKSNPLLWFALAKALFRSGNGGDAMIAAKHAADLDEGNRQIMMAVKSWKEREHMRIEEEKHGKVALDDVMAKVNKNLMGKKGEQFLEEDEEKMNVKNNDSVNEEGESVGPEESSSLPKLEDSSLSGTKKGPEVELEASNDQGEDTKTDAVPQSQPFSESISEATVSGSESAPANALPKITSPVTDRASSPNPEFNMFYQPDDASLISAPSIFNTVAAGSTSTKRTNAARIREVVSAQFGAKLMKRSQLRRELKLKLDAKNAEMKLVAESLLLEEKARSVDLPIWKRKHLEADLAKERARNRWRRVKNVGTLVSRKDFHPSFESRAPQHRKKSVERFKKLGYPSDTAQTYRSYWLRKISSLLGFMVDESELRRCVSDVKSHFPNIDNTHAFIALAEAAGSVEEACAKLSDRTFLVECDLVESIVDLSQFVRRESDDAVEVTNDFVDVSLDSISFLGMGSMIGSAPGSVNSVASALSPLQRIPSPALTYKAPTRVATAGGTRRTKSQQEKYMATLSHPTTRSNKKSAVDFMVGAFAIENSFGSSRQIRAGVGASPDIFRKSSPSFGLPTSKMHIGLFSPVKTPK